ncbi:MAG: peptide chain release factor N(5)-glutamine methyltransferase [Clostridia bacterium]|nr:peptide chain release factor N(5)-glutamine methyltransferase [Clostridia bacterium]
MTLSEIAKKLSLAGIEDHGCEAALLVCHFMNISRAVLLADGRTKDYSSPALEKAVEKRCTRYPLQYIIGKWEFFGLEFEVNENCLIPRPDTEILCEEAIRLLKPNGKLLDLCTGSGCIAAAVLHAGKNTVGIAVELYPETAALAEKNIKNLGLADRCRVITGDACTDLFPDDEKFDVITANPPYVTADEMNSLEPELDAEPSHALTDGGDGLSIIEAIVRIYSRHLVRDGVMLIEHGASQADAVKRIAEENGLSCRCIKDYGGNDRCSVMEFGK